MYCLRPEELFPLESSLCFDVEGNPEKVDVLYRFFELFLYQPQTRRGAIIAVATEIGYRVGRRRKTDIGVDSPTQAHLAIMQASVLGLIALVLGLIAALSCLYPSM